MSKGNPIVVRYKGLEILCRPETVIKYRQGKLPMSEVLITEDNVFKNVKKGNVASENDIKKALGKDGLSLNEVFTILLEKGDFQMTTKERQDLTNQRRQKLIEYFHENFLDPKTNGPIPRTRIETTFEQVKAKINYEMSFDKNVEEIRKSVLGVLPIKPKDTPGHETSNKQPPSKSDKMSVNVTSAVKTSNGSKKDDSN